MPSGDSHCSGPSVSAINLITGGDNLESRPHGQHLSSSSSRTRPGGQILRNRTSMHCSMRVACLARFLDIYTGLGLAPTHDEGSSRLSTISSYSPTGQGACGQDHYGY